MALQSLQVEKSNENLATPARNTYFEARTIRWAQELIFYDREQMFLKPPGEID